MATISNVITHMVMVQIPMIKTMMTYMIMNCSAG